jgi:hypothetical protein
LLLVETSFAAVYAHAVRYVPCLICRNDGHNRTGWKYQEWLAGFNGGALRAPAPRIPDRLMKQARAALVASGLPVTDLPDSEFVKGRTRD